MNKRIRVQSTLVASLALLAGPAMAQENVSSAPTVVHQSPRPEEGYAPGATPPILKCIKKILVGCCPFEKSVAVT